MKQPKIPNTYSMSSKAAEPTFITDCSCTKFPSVVNNHMTGVNQSTLLPLPAFGAM